MADKTYTVSFAGPAELIDPLFGVFVTATGWTETVPDPDHPGQTIANPIVALEWARLRLAGYVREVCVAYGAVQTAEAARVAAISSGTTTALLLTSSASVE